MWVEQGSWFFNVWIVIHRSCKSVQSFQMGVIRHVQSDWKQQVSYKSKNELRYEFDFCMWLGNINTAIWFQKFSVNQISRFFYITTVQNGLIFWLQCKQDNLSSWLKPTEFTLVLEFLWGRRLKLSLFCISLTSIRVVFFPSPGREKRPSDCSTYLSLNQAYLPFLANT